MAPKRNRSRTTPPIVHSRTTAEDVITYKVAGHEIHPQEFNFSHRLPPTLQRDVSSRSEWEAFMDQVVHEHHRELLEAYPWKCKCGLPATTLVHHPVVLRHREGDFLIRNHPIPVCVEGTPCWTSTVELNRDLMSTLTVIYPGSNDSLMPERTSLKRCAYCAKADTYAFDSLKMCGRCKVVCYCSSECQVADWPNHKKVCRHIAARNNK
jgi:hypothetical protein